MKLSTTKLFNYNYNELDCTMQLLHCTLISCDLKLGLDQSVKL